MSSLVWHSHNAIIVISLAQPIFVEATFSVSSNAILQVIILFYAIIQVIVLFLINAHSGLQRFFC